MADEERIAPMRLQKFLARAGVASRRGSENLITAGRVTVNGHVITQLGSKVDPSVDEVAVDGRHVSLPDSSVTIMLHKPAGYLTTMDDPQGRPTVAELVPADEYPGLFPLGRLDRDTTGLLLFSTDGELGHELLRPREQVTKQYLALVRGCPSEEALEHLRQGIELEDGPTLPAEIELLPDEAASRARAFLDTAAASPHKARKQRSDNACQEAFFIVRVGLHEGRKRQVRRMLEAVGHPVVALHRTSFGPLEIGVLPRGAWRVLLPDEVAALHCAVGHEK